MDILNFFTSFFETAEISVPEAVMFICFGISWPVSVFKALKTKRVTGKSPLFMTLIAIGYLSGITHKVLFSRNYLIVLYIFNLSMILTDLWLYVKYNLSETGIISSLRKWFHGAPRKDRKTIIVVNTKDVQINSKADQVLCKSPYL